MFNSTKRDPTTSTPRRLAALPLGLLLFGCSEAKDDMASTANEATSAAEESGSTGSETGEMGETGETGETEGTNECDVWTQDCPDGEKCVPWADDGGNTWNALRCVPVLGAGQPGDPCMLMGDSELTGLDDCADGSICMRLDDGTDNGVCVPQCQGSADEPTCDDSGRVCSIGNDGVMTLCMESCSPLNQECPDGLTCIPRWGQGDFICWPDFSGQAGAYADECMWANSCDPGLICWYPEAIPDCQSASCCTNYCNLDAPDPDSACPDQAQGQLCQSVDLGAEPLPGFENVGVCQIPS